jgi:uncharacterized protein
MGAWRLVALLAAAVSMSGCQPFIARFVLPREGIRDATFDVRITRDLAMQTSDGVGLVADLYRPAGLDRTPTILVRIPFSRSFANNLSAEAVGRFWARRGYTVVIQGTRGRFKSGGSHYPLVHERQDGLDTLRWLAAQPWFDGRLGMWGGSAFGHTQWAIADQRDPGPSALMIQIASSDFYEMFHPGGAFSLESALFWALRSRGPKDEVPSIEVLERGASAVSLLEADDRAAENVPMFDDWATHTRRDDYWRAVDGEARARTLTAPVLLMAGWSDPFLPTQLRDFTTIRREAAGRVAAESRLIVGPWTHAGAMRFPDGSEPEKYRPASLAPSIAWFDQHLLQRPPAAAAQAAVRLFVMGEGVWRDEHEWPLARTQYMAYYLSSGGKANSARGDGRLGSTIPASDQPPDVFDYDPARPVPSRGGAMLGPRAGMAEQASVEARADVLVYSTEPLTRPLEATGPVSVVLHVATTARHTDFTAKLVDVHPDGRAFNVSDGIRRRAFPAADGPGPHEIAIDLWPTSMLFRAGHRIRLEISSSNYPRYDRNPNTGAEMATAEPFVVATQTVHHRPGLASRLVLPVIPR